MNKKMRAAQISKPGGDWELIERDVPEPGSGKADSSIRACRDMKSGDASMRSATTSSNGRKVSASEWAGMADIVSSAHNASAEISPCA